MGHLTVLSCQLWPCRTMPTSVGDGGGGDGGDSGMGIIIILSHKRYKDNGILTPSSGLHCSHVTHHLVGIA